MKMLIAICFLVLCAAVPARLSAQATDCNDPSASSQANALAQEEWEKQSSPVYADATVLAHDLARRGIKVECIRRSKEENLFKNQKGAAWFKTNQGIFEVWFMPDAGPLRSSSPRLRRGQHRFICRRGRASSSFSIKT